MKVLFCVHQQGIVVEGKVLDAQRIVAPAYLSSYLLWAALEETFLPESIGGAVGAAVWAAA
jgi:hypothetical protein